MSPSLRSLPFSEFGRFGITNQTHPKMKMQLYSLCIFRDGKITTHELLAALQKNDGLSEEKARDLCELLDQDKDGTLHLDELKRVRNFVQHRRQFFRKDCTIDCCIPFDSTT